MSDVDVRPSLVCESDGLPLLGLFRSDAATLSVARSVRIGRAGEAMAPSRSVHRSCHAPDQPGA